MWNPPFNEDRRKSEEFSESKGNVKVSMQTLDKSAESHKAVVVLNNKPIFGTIEKVTHRKGSPRQRKDKVYITMVTNDEEKFSFEATSKLANNEFKLISDEVFKTLSADKHMFPYQSLLKLSGPEFFRGKESEKKSQNSHVLTNESDLMYAEVGDYVQTLILSGNYRGIWIKAEVQAIDADTMDLRVVHPRKWRVAGTALEVPKKFIRPLPETDKHNYIIPVEFALDGSKLYLSCNKRMRVKHLKIAVSQQRGVEPCQLIFICKGSPLLENSPIPDYAVFCILCKKGGMTETQVDLLSRKMKRKRADNLRGKRISDSKSLPDFKDTSISIYRDLRS